MEKFCLSPRDSIETNVEKIINLVIELEKQNGLELEEIKVKYTRGFCGYLAQLVKVALLVTTGQRVGELKVDLDIPTSFPTFSTQAKYEHMYITFKDPNSPPTKFPPDTIFVDILGKHHSRDYAKFTSDPFLIDQELNNKYNISSPKVREKWRSDFDQIQHQIFYMINEMVDKME